MTDPTDPLETADLIRRVGLTSPQAARHFTALAVELARVKAEMASAISSIREETQRDDPTTLTEWVAAMRLEVNVEYEARIAAEKQLEKANARQEQSDRMIVALSGQAQQVKAELEVWESSSRMAHDTTLQLERMTKALIAKIDGDGGHAQKDETVAQSCERAGKVVAELRECKHWWPGQLQTIRLALNDPTATVEQICQALRERREAGEALCDLAGAVGANLDKVPAVVVDAWGPADHFAALIRAKGEATR